MVTHGVDSYVLYLQMTQTYYLVIRTCLKTLNEIIQIEMNKITDWLNVNKLSINTTKTKFIIFRSKNKKPKQDIKIFLNSENIKVEVKSVLRIGSAHNNVRTSNVNIAQISNVSNFSEHKLYFIFI